jgi:hypothetical protein
VVTIRQSTELEPVLEETKRPAHWSELPVRLALKLFCAFSPPLERFAFLIWPQIMLEAVSKMGETNYDATDITSDSAVKYVLFQCEIQLTLESILMAKEKRQAR